MDSVRLAIDAVRINIVTDWDHIMNRRVITKMTMCLCRQGNCLMAQFSEVFDLKIFLVFFFGVEIILNRLV